MEEKLDLTQILKNVPKGTKLYSTIYGEVVFKCINNNDDDKYTIKCIAIDKDNDRVIATFNAEGKYFCHYDGECTLFPSKDNRDWSNFNPIIKRFNPEDFKPFDKVLVRRFDCSIWSCDLFSYLDINLDNPAICINRIYTQCIPYNTDTEHLLGTKDEAPIYYQWWLDKLKF